MAQWKDVGHRVGTSGYAVGRAAGAVIERLQARCLLSAVLFVDDSAAGSGDGSSWDNAFTDLQAALTQVGSGDEIHIAAGTYKPTSTTDRTISFQLKDGVSLLGGYAGYGAADPDAHDIGLYPTIFSGDIGTVGDNTDNSYHVIAGSGISSATVLDGITITAGYADGISVDSYGGGMYSNASSPTLTNCIFSGNTASGSSNDSGWGGGMYNYNVSSPTLTNCTFSGNAASGSSKYSGYGGGMYNLDSSPALSNCTFSGNTASGSIGSSGDSGISGYGGGMYNLESSPTLANCTFSGNTASGSSPNSGYGGGMYDYSSSPILTNCTFSGNTASSYGGGMYNDYSSSPTLTNCTFTGDMAARGGGMSNYSSSSPTLTNCTINGNTAAYGGGMYNNYYSSPTLANCTFSGNTASGSGDLSGDGGGMYNNSSTPTLTNCTFSGNTASGIGDLSGDGGGMHNSASSSSTLSNTIFWDNGSSPIDNDNSSKPVVTYSDIQGGYTGIGNIDVDPLFVRSPSCGADGVWSTADDDYGDLRLQLDSPCINAGYNAAPGLVGITTDLAGLPRIIGGTVDMGAYENGAFGAKHSLTLTDIDKDTVRIGIRGGGEGELLPDNTIALTDTTAKSVLTITVKKGVGGDGLFDLSGITSDGLLKGIAGSAVILTGDVQIGGSVGLITIHSMTGTMNITGSLTTLSIGGSLAGAVTVTGNAGSISSGGLMSGLVTVDGDVTTISAGQFTGNLTARSFGSITTTTSKTVGVTRTMAGTIEATGASNGVAIGTLSAGGPTTGLTVRFDSGTIGTMTVKGDATNLTLHGQGVTKTLDVQGRLIGSLVQLQGNTGDVTVDAMLGSHILVGVVDSVTDTATFFSEFLLAGVVPTPVKLKSFTVHGLPKVAGVYPTAVSDSSVSAGAIGTVALKNVAATSGAFGLAVLPDRLGSPSSISMKYQNNSSLNRYWRYSNKTPGSKPNTLFSDILLTIASSPYVVTDLGVTSSTGDGAKAINAIGQVGVALGTYSYVWTNGVFSPPGGINDGNGPLGINDLGHLTGSGDLRGFIYRDGQSTGLGQLEPDYGSYTFAHGINDSDVIVGEAYRPSVLRYHAFVWSDGVIHDLTPNAPSGVGSSARAINNAGTIVGQYNTSAARWDAMGNLTGLVTPSGYVQSEAVAVNGNGDAVGTSHASDFFTEIATVWPASGAWAYTLPLLVG